MLEAVRILTTATKYTDEQLEGIAREFGNHCEVDCRIPVEALIHARREYENFKQPQDATTSCARIVMAAEAFLDACGNDPLVTEHPAREWQEPLLALSREVDNLRNRTRRAEPVKRRVQFDKMTLPSKDRIISRCVDILRNSKSRTAATKAGQKPG